MTPANSNAVPEAGRAGAPDEVEYVTVHVADALFGLPIDRVHDVFIPAGMTDVPLAPPEIAGLLNLRGRVVTAICLRRRLGLPDRDEGARTMAVGLEQGGEAYGLLVDSVGEVMRLAAGTHEPNPVHMDARWRGLSRGVQRLADHLLVLLDVDAVLAFEAEPRAASAA